MKINKSFYLLQYGLMGFISKFIHLSKLWAEGKQWIDIKKNYVHMRVFFEKYIKLTNLVRNIVVIAKITNNVIY